MRYSITSNLLIYQTIGRNMFSIGKFEVSNTLEILCIPQDALTQADDMWNESTLSITLHSIIFYDKQGAKFM